MTGESGLDTVGYVGKGELVEWSLEGGVNGELDDYVVGKGIEEY